jgi:Ca-activated chloride channel homolog
MRAELRRGLAAAFLGTVALAAAPTIQQRADAPRIVIESPKENEFISGPTTIRVRVLPASQPVERVTFTVDARVACVVEQPPFVCEWDVGSGVNEHQIRVVAQLPNQAALRRTIRTAASEFALGVEVAEVHVTATVTDSSGRWVRDLRASHFRVSEDGVPQTIDYFKSSNIPLELVAAVDTSGSMADAMPQVKQAVKAFLTALRPQDRVTVIAFNHRIFTIGPPNVDLATRLRGVDRLAPWGGTSLYEVVIRALEMQGRQTGRRAVVLFTDGEDRNSLVPMAAAERRVEASDSLLYLIGLGQGARVPALRQVMERFAQISGGRAFFAEAATQLGDAFSQIVDELSNQYLLGYQPKNDKKDGGWRKISVQLDNPDYRVRARQGYRAQAAGASR